MIGVSGVFRPLGNQHLHALVNPMVASRRWRPLSNDALTRPGGKGSRFIIAVGNGVLTVIGAITLNLLHSAQAGNQGLCLLQALLAHRCSALSYGRSYLPV